MTRAGLGLLGVLGGSDDTYRWWAQGCFTLGRAAPCLCHPRGHPPPTALKQVLVLLPLTTSQPLGESFYLRPVVSL